jgi:alkylation response protein AidB-like acyl-CoA dehydrogenase
LDFRFTSEQALMRTTVREFAQREVAPNIDQYEEGAAFPADIVQKMGELGLMGIWVPAEYGGSGGDNMSWVTCLEELARVYSPVGSILLAHSHAARVMLYAGTDDQKREHLGPMSRGEALGAFALTEPQAGSDAAGIQTSARKDGDHYVLNGEKCFISNWGVAALYVIAAVTDPRPGERRISFFIVRDGTPGLHLGVRDRKMALPIAPTGNLILDDCHVPSQDMLGVEGEGLRIALAALTQERCGNAALSLGNAEAAYEYTLGYLKNRIAFGQPLAAFQGIQWMLADMAIQLEAARLLVYEAAWLVDEHEATAAKQIAIAKTFANEAAMRITTDCVQLLGGHGYMKDHPVERLMREAKLWAIGGGTTQVQRNIIGHYILR